MSWVDDGVWGSARGDLLSDPAVLHRLREIRRYQWADLWGFTGWCLFTVQSELPTTVNSETCFHSPQTARNYSSLRGLIVINWIVLGVLKYKTLLFLVQYKLSSTELTLCKDPPAFITVSMSDKPWFFHATHHVSEKYITEEIEQRTDRKDKVSAFKWSRFLISKTKYCFIALWYDMTDRCSTSVPLY